MAAAAAERDCDPMDTPAGTVETSEMDVDAAHQELLQVLTASDPSLTITPELSNYIRTLCNTPLDKLTTLPGHLTATSQTLLKSLQNATIAHHRPLLTSFTLAHSTHATLLTLHTALSDLLALLATLSSCLTRTPAPSTLNPRNNSLSTLSHASHALDLLSAPGTLLQPLLNSSHYSEALTLITYLHNLTRTYPDIPILQSLASNELPRATILVRSTLESRLEEPLPLPQTLQTTTLLQRLLPLLPPPTPSPLYLRQVFLRRRWACMRPKSLLSSSATATTSFHVHLSPSSSTPPLSKLAKTTTTAANPIVTYCSDFRSGMFEVLTQYRAVFQQDNTETNNHNSKSTSTKTLTIKNKSPTDKITNEQKHDVILESWVSIRVNEFLKNLDVLFNSKSMTRKKTTSSTHTRDYYCYHDDDGGNGHGHMDGASLFTGLQQAIYAGTSLGRFGLDFRSLLIPIFCKAVIQMFQKEVDFTVQHFSKMILEFDWEAPVGGGASGSSIVGTDGGPDKDSHDEKQDNGVAAQDNDDDGQSMGLNRQQIMERQREMYEVPDGILEYGPLAVFVNGVLHALNELRVCCPEGIGREIHGRLENALVEVASLMEAVGGVGGCLIVNSDFRKDDRFAGGSGMYGLRQDVNRGRKGWEGMAHGLRLVEGWLGRCCTRVVGEGWKGEWVRCELDERLGVKEDTVDVRVELNVQKTDVVEQ